MKKKSLFANTVNEKQLSFFDEVTCIISTKFQWPRVNNINFTTHELNNRSRQDTYDYLIYEHLPGLVWLSEYEIAGEISACDYFEFEIWWPRFCFELSGVRYSLVLDYGPPLGQILVNKRWDVMPVQVNDSAELIYRSTILGMIKSVSILARYSSSLDWAP
jgi:hypothetical protein